MSHSKKKHPIGKSGWGKCSFSEKDWKQTYNRKIRRKVAMTLTNYSIELEDDIFLPERYIEFADTWDSKTDGPKRYFGDLKLNKQEYNPYYRLNYNLSRGYEITKENIHLAKEEIGEKFVILDIEYYINRGHSYYYWSKKVYNLTETMDEMIIRHKNLYNKIMRK